MAYVDIEAVVKLDGVCWCEDGWVRSVGVSVDPDLDDQGCGVGGVVVEVDVVGDVVVCGDQEAHEFPGARLDEGSGGRGYMFVLAWGNEDLADDGRALGQSPGDVGPHLADVVGIEQVVVADQVVSVQRWIVGQALGVRVGGFDACDLGYFVREADVSGSVLYQAVDGAV
ncbi:MAG: hypothetical protein DRJ45_08430 [Thermoprotei archaeon]|nr:MAG: hypothetical protein DRJ45_08430 [Thermoprotei archaeon]